jgi:hypothetical protein
MHDNAYLQRLPDAQMTMRINLPKLQAIEAWPGMEVGVRPPRNNETPLSDAECRHGIAAGILNFKSELRNAS